ncbi:hypothetical protein [Paenibacillus sp. FSL R7-0128]|uniref:hypothetical protein n=1 Tax=Paenibacillus sp. FSL R7-0128 TaxID=2954529 RepID=UPI0030F6DADB
MTTKVTIPREVADALETLRSGTTGIPVRDNAYICELAMRTGGGGVPVSTQVLRQIPFDTLLAALVNGYERELTEEEKRERAYGSLRQMYAHHYDDAFEDYSDGWCEGVVTALTTLGIVIPGVNDVKETEEHAYV